MDTRTWRHRLAGAAVLILACVTPAQALNLAQAWQLALQRDPAYAAVQAARQADQEVVPQARARLLPYLVASAGAEIDNTRRRSNL